jgi:hypothetical protein
MPKGLQQAVEMVVAAMSRLGASPLSAEQIRIAKLGGRESSVSAVLDGDAGGGAGAHFEEVLGPDRALAKGELGWRITDKDVMRYAAVTSSVPAARLRHRHGFGTGASGRQTLFAIHLARLNIHIARLLIGLGPEGLSHAMLVASLSKRVPARTVYLWLCNFELLTL